MQGDIEPDLTILLDAPVEVGMARAGSRGDPDRFESERMEFFERVRASYLELAGNQQDRFVVIDAAGSLADVQEAVEAVAQELILNFN